MTRYPCAFIFSGKPHTMQFVQTNRSCFGPWSAPLFGRETHIVTVLLLDLGNTALKWTTLDKPEEPQTYVHGGHGTPPDELLRTWSALKPTRVVGCMVSSEMLALSLTKFFNAHGIPWEWLHSEPVFRGNFELTNGYENCRQLGSDRWFAAIGAASLYPGLSLLVVHMGTATTVDSVVSENGRLVFCGGRILPGPAMMYESLVKGTRCRPNGIGAVEPFPKIRTPQFPPAFWKHTSGLLSTPGQQCRTKDPTSKSFSPAALHRFWRRTSGPAFLRLS